MRKINKFAPYEDFVRHILKNKPSKWDEIDGALKFNMRLYMLTNEQDCLCGYSEIPLEAENTSSHIDHFIKREYDNTKIFDWDNLITSAIDEDFGGKYKDNTYKIQKKEYSQIFNPVIDDMTQFIEYSGDGSIIPQKDIDKINTDKVKKTIEVFNLKQTSLKNRRKALLDSVQSCKDLTKDKVKQYFQSCGFISLIEWFLKTY